MYQSLPAIQNAATLQDFKFLPAFASWLQNKQLAAFTEEYLTQIHAKVENLPDSLQSIDSATLTKTLTRTLTFLAENKTDALYTSLSYAFKGFTAAAQLHLVHLAFDSALKLLPQYQTDQSLSLAIVREGLACCNTFCSSILEQSTSMVGREQEQLLSLLSASEQKYKEAELIAHVGHFSYDIGLQKHVWTDELYRIFGWTPGSDAISVKRVNRAVLKEDLPALKKAISLGIANHESFMASFRIRNQTGKIRHLQARAHIRCDESGIPTALFGVVQDVSETAVLMQRLQQSKELYKQAQAIAKIGNWRFEVNTGKTYWSAEASKLFGLPPSENHEADLNTIFSMTPFRCRILIDGNINRCVRTGEDFSFEMEAHLADGSHRFFLNNGIADFDDSGKITGVVGTIQDITEQKITENILKENQLFSKKITDATPAIIWLADKETNRFSFVNSMVERTLGFTSTEIMQLDFLTFKDLIHPGESSEVNEQMMQLFEDSTDACSGDDNRILENTFRIRHKQGHWVWLHSFSTVFSRNPETGQIAQMLHISIDVTSIRLAEEQLQQKNQLLQQSNASLQEFAYVASHDLQEPLRKIASFGSMLQSLGESPNPEKARLYTDKMVSSSRRMQNMINDLLMVSLISGNTSFKTTCLQTILDETPIMQELQEGVDPVRVLLTAPLPTARVIPSQIQQLFQNLLSNAVKFARPAVPVVIQINWEELPAGSGNKYGLDGGNAFLKITISDNGIGFDNEYAQRIFAMFQRLNGRSEYEGTGIGLAICRKIAGHHGGTIFATGVKNEGAEFSVLLPVS